MTTIMRLYILSPPTRAHASVHHGVFCKVRARDVFVTYAELLWFDKTRGRVHASDENSARQYCYCRQICLHQGGNRQACLPMSVGIMAETYVRRSLQRGSSRPGRTTGTTPRLYTRVTCNYSGRGSLCRHTTRSVASAEPTQLFPFQ